MYDASIAFWNDIAFTVMLDYQPNWPYHIRIQPRRGYEIVTVYWYAACSLYHLCFCLQCTVYWCTLYFTRQLYVDRSSRVPVGGSVLLQDEANSRSGHDMAINMDAGDRQRYQQQLQLIDEQVTMSPSHHSQPLPSSF